MNTRTVSSGAWAALVLGICLSAGVALGAQPVVTNQPIALSGQPAPGGEAGETFLSFQGTPSGPSPVINARGDIAFVSVVSRPSGDPVEVLFLHRNGALERVAEQGAAVPGQPNLLFGQMSGLAINDFGEVMFMNYGNEESLVGNVGGIWRVLAREQTQVPGLPPGTQFESLAAALSVSYPQQFLLRSDGAVGAAFGARTRLPPTLGTDGLWLINPPATDPFPLLAYGGPAPDLRGGETLLNFNAIFSFAFGSAPAGILAFDGTIAGPGVEPTNNQVLWAGPPTSLKVIARSGQPAPPPIIGQFYQGFWELGVNGAGQLCFVADLARSPVDQALFTGTPTNLSLVVRTGDALPGGGSLRNFDWTAINVSGQVGFLATISIQGGSSRGIYLWSPATGLKLVALQGGACPGAPTGWTIDQLQPWNLNAAGRMAFFGTARAPIGSLGGGEAWWITDTNGTPVLLAQNGIPQPADPQGVLAVNRLLRLGLGSITEFAGGQDGRRRFLSDSNHVVFEAELGGGQSGIFRGQIAGDDHPFGEEFLLSLRSGSVFARIQPATFLDGRLTNGAFVGTSAVFQAAELKNWDGGKVSLEITANANEQDRLGIGPSRRGIGVTADGLTVLFKNVAIGEVRRGPNGLEVALNSEATTEGVFQLLRSLAYGSTENLEDLLRIDPRHTEPNRVLRLRVADAGGRTQEVVLSVEYPRTVGLALAGHRPEDPLVFLFEIDDDSYKMTLSLMLRLSDGTTVFFPDRSHLPIGLEVWTFSSSEFEVSTTEPAVLYRVFKEERRDSVGVQLLDWREEFLVVVYLYDSIKSLESCLSILAHRFFGGQSSFSSGPSLLVETSGSPKTDFLANPYALREWMRGSPEGRRLVQLYEQHSPELVRIVLTNSTLLNDAAALMSEFLPGLSQFLSANGDDRVIRPDMIEQLNRVWDAFEAAGSPGLKTTLVAERARFSGFQDFVGHTFGDWGQLLEIGVPATPYITLSSPRRTNQVFYAEANRSEGLSYALQRTPPVFPLNWTDVTNASIQHFGYRVELADTNAVDASFLYRLQATMNPVN